MSQSGDKEVEVKIRLEGLESVQQSLRMAGAVCTRPRIYEHNVTLDTPDAALRSRGELIRLRSVGEDRVLTYKGKGESGKHKSREELELRVESAETMQRILERLGFVPGFRYEKYRTEYRLGEGTVTVDETPIGNFLELEGPPDWIDRTAVLLGYSEKSYITGSYADLYQDSCRERGLPVGDFTFSDHSS